MYSEFIKECNYDIDAFAATTPFDRKQLYDLYTKFKALSKFTRPEDALTTKKHEGMPKAHGVAVIAPPSRSLLILSLTSLSFPPRVFTLGVSVPGRAVWRRRRRLALFHVLLCGRGAGERDVRRAGVRAGR